MKNNYFNPLRLLWTAVLGLFFVTAQAQLVQGKVYRFDNVGYEGYSLAAGTSKAAIAQATDENERAQMWYVSETKTVDNVTTYRLRNLRYGYYLQGNGRSASWSTVRPSVTDDVYLYLRSYTTGGETYYTLSLTDNNSNDYYDKMHCDSGYKIVGWSFTDNSHTQWTIHEVTTISDIELNAIWTELDKIVWDDSRTSTVQSYLDNLFTDKACTELNDTYKAMTQKDLQEDANYTKLPPTLQTMVLKTWRTQTTASGVTQQTVSEAWGEAHYNVSDSEDLAWDGEYAKRFRVQLYEPYSERDCTNAGLHINPHTNLNNPTGIIGNEGDALYIMVKGTIKTGASLYLGAYSGHGQGGAYNDGEQLHEGLNVVPIKGNKQWTCIYYTVPTLQEYTAGENIAGSNKRYDITTFPDLKIHIEGGYVNGFYNAVGDDLWAHNAATTGCDDGRNLSTLATTLTKADGTTTPANNNLLQTNNVYPKGDNEADWDYIAARNVLDDLTILGRYMVFQFYFNSPEAGSHPEYCTNYWFTKLSDGTRRINICDWLERWDRIMMSERLMMGLLSEQEVTEANARYHAWNSAFGSIPENHDIFRYTGNENGNQYACNYANYYRMHGMAISNDTGYMSGGWNSSNYQYATLADIIGKMTDETSSGGVCWGPAHEIGHQHQGPLNMRGLTEVSNNFFSNVAVWYDGRGTSRTAEGQGDLSSVLNAYNQDGNDFYTNNIWAQTQMYYKLWLYYHLVGHNTAFAPTLIEMLRQDPMTIQYNQAGATSLLHFYKKACDAAGEDLTDFFRAYGFLEVMDHRYVGDYSSAEYTQTQEDINAAIAYVKAKNYPENVEILFINDYTAGATYVKHDGTTERRLWDGNTYSDLGSFQAYESGSAATGTYTMTAANGQVTMSGATGGVGFVIRDADGNLLAFSSDYTFPVSDAAMAAIGAGTAVLQSVATDGTVTEITYDGSSAAVSLLSGLLTTVKTLLDGDSDDGGEDGNSYTKPGLYKENNANYTALASKYTDAKEIYDNANVAQYMVAYTALKDCYDALLTDEYATVPLLPGNKYTLRCKGRGQTYMYLSSETTDGTTTYKVVCTTTLPASTEANYNTFLWSVEETGTDGKYYLKNASGENLYVLTVSAQNNEQFQCGSAKYAFGIQPVATGSNYFHIYHSDKDTYMNADGNNKVVSWYDDDDDNSQWTFSLVEADDVAKARILLEEMESKTRTLLESMATVGVKGPQDMTLFGITSNSVEQGHGTELLIDGDASTYYHSNWDTSSASASLAEDHYLQIDCGEGNNLEQFQFNYITLPSGAGNLDAPAAIDVYVGNTVDGDGNVTDFTKVTTLTKDDADNPLPCISRAQSYTSPVIGTVGSPYRFIRLTVTNATKDNAVTNGTLNGHHWFGLAELGLSRATSKVYASDSRYTIMTNEKYVTAADALGNAAICLANADATADELTDAYNALSEQYTILQNAYTAAETEDLTTAQEALQSVIDQTQNLLAACGSISRRESVALQCSDEAGAYYISSNAEQNAGGGGTNGGGVAALLDEDLTSYFHSRWSGTEVDEDHYLQVDMGAEDALKNFTFGYTVRQTSANNSPHPTIIEVYGSNDGTDFSTKLATFQRTDAANPLPAYTESGASWTSSTIESTTAYRYVRFVVTKSDGPGDKIYGGHYFFAMGTFSLTKVETKVTLSEDCGSATEQDLLDTDDALQSAIAAKSIATTVEQLTATQAALQAQYYVLWDAKNSISTADLETAITNLQAAYTDCFTDATCTTIKDEYSSSVNLTQALLEEVKTAIEAAQTVVEANGHTQAEINTQQATLEALQERLETAKAYTSLPVKLSTDDEKVYYSITIDRDGHPVLEYGGVGGETNKLKVTGGGFEYGNSLQAFYFTKGSTAPQVFMHAKSDDNILTARIVDGASDLAEGPGKVAGVDPATDDAELSSKEWIIEANTSGAYSGWYNIRPIPLNGSSTNLYMSNYNGVGYNIGFYTVANDGESCFQFTEQTIWDKSEAFYTLYSYYTNSVKVHEVIETQYMSDAPGYYNSEKANTYNEAYIAANAAINLALNGSTSITDNDLTKAYNTLVKANEELTFNLPEAGKYYVLRSACTQATYCTNALAYVNQSNADQQMYWSKDKTTTDATAIWTITPNEDGTFALRNLHTGTAVRKFNERLADAAGSVALTSLDYKTGELKLVADGTIMHAQEYGSKIVHWPAGAGSASAWRIEEVADLSAVSYVLNMSQYRHAGFYSAYPVEIPDGLQAYYVKQDDVTTGTAETPGTAHLTEIADVIPANTGVILYGDQGSYALKYAAGGGTPVDDNMLMGSPYLCYKLGEADTKYYLFGVKNEEVGLYVAWLEYTADGSQTITQETTAEDGTTTSTSVNIDDTDDGGYFRVGANKIYLPYSTTTQGVAAFHLDFNTGVETAIDPLELLPRNAVIYDLQGRRISQIRHSGIYIVNGVKRYVRTRNVQP